MNCSILRSSCAILLLGFGLTDFAVAVDAIRQTTTGAVNNCQGALPVFDGKLRKRPLAFANEGDSNAFVTCSVDLPARVSSVLVFALTGGKTLTCTGVAGTSAAATSFVTKSSSDPQGFLEYTPAEFGGPPGIFFNNQFSLSCSLQPGVELSFIRVTGSEPVGQ